MNKLSREKTTSNASETEKFHSLLEKYTFFSPPPFFKKKKHIS